MVFVFFGLVAVIGTTYVQTETLPLPALYAAVGIGALACAILVANNLRDIPTDRECRQAHAGRRARRRAHPRALRAAARGGRRGRAGRRRAAHQPAGRCSGWCSLLPGGAARPGSCSAGATGRA